MCYEFFIDNILSFFYYNKMYATEKYVRFEVKELNAQIRELANDLGGDVRFLSQQIHDITERLQLLESNFEEMVNEVRNQNES